jgi:hypothetical protein
MEANLGYVTNCKGRAGSFHATTLHTPFTTSLFQQLMTADECKECIGTGRRMQASEADTRPLHLQLVMSVAASSLPWHQSQLC